jgi:hypothetical protein
VVSGGTVLVTLSVPTTGSGDTWVVGDYDPTTATFTPLNAIITSGESPLVGQAQTSLAAAVLPSTRSVTVGVPATFFATIVNGGDVAGIACVITPATSIPATFRYQPTDPATNQGVGPADVPVTIAPRTGRSFVLTLVPRTSFFPVDVGLDFRCANTESAPVVPELNTLVLSAATSPVPDIVALAVTGSGDGILSLPAVGAGAAFATATINVGGAGTLTVAVDTGGLSLPLATGLCETDPATGSCTSEPAAGLTRTYEAGEARTFAVFVTALGSIPFAPDTNRIFVRFTDESGVRRGSTSVAVRTDALPGGMAVGVATGIFRPALSP